MTPPYQPRDIGAEYRENVAKLKAKIPDLPTLVVTAEQGWGQRVFDAFTKQQLPESGPCNAYSIRYAHHYDTKGQAEAVADYLITLPVMAEALAEEIDRLKTELSTQKRESAIKIRELTKERNSLFQFAESGIKLHLALSEFGAQASEVSYITSSIRPRQELEPEFEMVDADYGRAGYQVVQARPGAVPVYTEEMRRADQEKEGIRRLNEFNRTKGQEPEEDEDEP